MGHTTPENPRENNLPDEAEAEFRERVEKHGSEQNHMETRCWEWSGNVHENGYGRFWWKGSYYLAHRVSYRFAHGEVPNGAQILHRCDVKTCVHPDHLYAGTHSDNAIDGWERGQRTKLYGEDNPMAGYEWSEEQIERTKHVGEDNGRAKLAEDDVRDIRARYEAGGVSQQDLADEYGVSQRMVSLIVRGESWTHVD